MNKIFTKTGLKPWGKKSWFSRFYTFKRKISESTLTGNLRMSNSN